MSTLVKEICHGAEVDVYNSVKEMLSQRCLVIILKSLGHDRKYKDKIVKRAAKLVLRKVAVCIPYVDLTTAVTSAVPPQVEQPEVEQPDNADAQVDESAHVDLDLNSSTWGSDYVDPFDASQSEASDSTTLDDNYVGNSVYSPLEQSIGGDDEEFIISSDWSDNQ